MAGPRARVLPDQEHFVAGGFPMRLRLARAGPKRDGFRPSAGGEQLAIQGPGTLRIARVQATDLHPPFAIPLDRDRRLGGERLRPMTELLCVAARQVRITVDLVQASPGWGTIRPLREVAVILRRAPLGP